MEKLIVKKRVKFLLLISHEEEPQAIHVHTYMDIERERDGQDGNEFSTLILSAFFSIFFFFICLYPKGREGRVDWVQTRREGIKILKKKKSL